MIGAAEIKTVLDYAEVLTEQEDIVETLAKFNIELGDDWAEIMPGPAHIASYLAEAVMNGRHPQEAMMSLVVSSILGGFLAGIVTARMFEEVGGGPVDFDSLMGGEA